MRDISYQASVDLAREKGPFPLLDAEQYLAQAAHCAGGLGKAACARQFFQTIRHQMYFVSVNHRLIFASPSGLMQKVLPLEFHLTFKF